MQHYRNKGFTLIEVMVGVCVFAVIGTVGYVLFNKPAANNGIQTSPRENTSPTMQDSISFEEVRWQRNSANEWTASGGMPPECPVPLLTQSPVDVTKATAVLYPGQYRGSQYKAHGGFRFDNQETNNAEVVLPMDAVLTEAARYIEAGEVQYLFTFVHPCGIMLRFDHLLTLTPKFAAIVETLPEPKVEDSRGTFFDETLPFEKGTMIATAVGFSIPLNVSVDFGLYDLRAKNQISNNTTWAALHVNEKSQAYYAVCWLDVIPAIDKEIVQRILPLSIDSNSASDYCMDAAGGTTLDYNSGKPV